MILSLISDWKFSQFFLKLTKEINLKLCMCVKKKILNFQEQNFPKGHTTSNPHLSSTCTRYIYRVLRTSEHTQNTQKKDQLQSHVFVPHVVTTFLFQSARPLDQGGTGLELEGLDWPVVPECSSCGCSPLGDGPNAGTWQSVGPKVGLLAFCLFLSILCKSVINLQLAWEKYSTIWMRKRESFAVKCRCLIWPWHWRWLIIDSHDFE